MASQRTTAAPADPGATLDTDTFIKGLWRENPGLVQLLGLCPLLAVTSTFVNGLGLGIATLLVLTFSNVLVSATRRWIPAPTRRLSGPEESSRMRNSMKTPARAASTARPRRS